jgi:hypothetical protein
MSIISNLIISLFLLIHPVQSSQSNHAVTPTLGKVYCDNLNQSCHSDTLSDTSQGQWNIDIDNPNNLSLSELNAKYQGKLIKIVYSGDIQNDDQIDIISEDIIN